MNFIKILLFILILLLSKSSFSNQLPVLFGIKLASPLSNYTNIIDSRNGGQYLFNPKKPDPYIDYYYFDAHKFSEKIYAITAIKRNTEINNCLIEKNQWSKQIKNNYGNPTKTNIENAYNGKILTINAIERLEYSNFLFDIRCSGKIFSLTIRADNDLQINMWDENDKLNNPKREYLE